MRRLLAGGLIAGLIAGLTLGGAGLASDWYHALTRVQWQLRDTARAAEAVAATAERSVRAGRPVAMSALRGDVTVMDQQLDRLELRLQELESLPVPEGQPPTEGP